MSTVDRVAQSSRSSSWSVARWAPAMLLARRNLRADRADRRGAARLVAFLATPAPSRGSLAAHHGASIDGEITSLDSCRRAGVVLRRRSSGRSISRWSRTSESSGRTACSGGRDCSPATSAIRAWAATCSSALLFGVAWPRSIWPGRRSAVAGLWCAVPDVWRLRRRAGRRPAWCSPRGSVELGSIQGALLHGADHRRAPARCCRGCG